MKNNKLLNDKQERDYLFNRIKTLQHELTVARDDADYYKELLDSTRKRILTIKNLTGAVSVVADSETQNEAWMRNLNEIIEVLKSGTARLPKRID